LLAISKFACIFNLRRYTLLGFHVFLIVTAQTTWEVSSGKEKISYLRGGES